MSELLKCPFCGGEAKPYKYLRKYLIECEDCKEYGHGAYVAAPTEAEAIEAWNTRHVQGDGWEYDKHSVPATEENMAKYGWVCERTCENAYEYRDSNGVLHRDARIFRCSECGFKVNDFYGDDEQSFPRYCPNCGRKVIT